MKQFHELAAELSHVLVNAPDYGGAHGTLTLAGEESKIELIGHLPIDDVPPPGWLDLRLCLVEGREIFIHNALRTSMTFPVDGEVSSATFYPNYVVDDAAGLDDDGRCRQISFGLDGWLACFGYNYIEKLYVHGGKEHDLKRTLEGFRYDHLQNKPFAPQHTFIVNNLGPIVDFEVNQNRYSIHVVQHHSYSPDQLGVKISLRGTITFSKAVDLDAATGACWDWRCYFNQMAMSQFAFTGISVAATTELNAPQGSLYLPSEQRSRAGRPRSDLRLMALSRWEERASAERAMQAWLSRHEERQYFRAALDRVLARPGHVAIEDIVALCAAVDTVPELSAKETIPKQVLDAMAAAAISAAADADVSVDHSRVRGLLGSLQNDDLRRRLRRMTSIAAPETQTETIEQWIGAVLSLRTFGAHGRIPKNDYNLMAGPAAEALAALCARYDLQGAGVPNGSRDSVSSLAQRVWDQGLMNL